jgi:hypothetical protein
MDRLSLRRPRRWSARTRGETSTLVSSWTECGLPVRLGQRSARARPAVSHFNNLGTACSEGNQLGRFSFIKTCNQSPVCFLFNLPAVWTGKSYHSEDASPFCRSSQFTQRVARGLTRLLHYFTVTVRLSDSADIPPSTPIRQLLLGNEAPSALLSLRERLCAVEVSIFLGGPGRDSGR